MAVRAHHRRRSPAAGIASCVDCARLLASRQPTTSRSSSATQIRALLRTRLYDTVWPVQTQSLSIGRNNIRPPRRQLRRNAHRRCRADSFPQHKQARPAFVFTENVSHHSIAPQGEKERNAFSRQTRANCASRVTRGFVLSCAARAQKRSSPDCQHGPRQAGPNERRRLLSRSMPKRQHRPRDALATMLAMLSSAALASRSDAPKRISALQGDRHGGFRRPSFLRS